MVMDNAYTIKGYLSSPERFNEQTQEKLAEALKVSGLLDEVILHNDRIGFTMDTKKAKGRYLPQDASEDELKDISFADALKELIALDDLKDMRMHGRFTHKANNGFTLSSMIFVEARNVIQKIIPESL